jgi:hypothetical protein
MRIGFAGLLHCAIGFAQGGQDPTILREIERPANSRLIRKMRALR